MTIRAAGSTLHAPGGGDRGHEPHPRHRSRARRAGRSTAAAPRSRVLPAGVPSVERMGATVAPVVRRPNPHCGGGGHLAGLEVMFFGGLFAAYFTVKAANDEWPPAGVDLDTPRAGLFTLVLVASSFTLHRAERASHAEARNWTLLTLALGVVFLGNQALEWATNDFSVSTDAFGTLYYALTGFHGLHVAIGLVLLAARAATRGRDRLGARTARPPPGTGTSSTWSGSFCSPPSSSSDEALAPLGERRWDRGVRRRGRSRLRRVVRRWAGPGRPTRRTPRARGRQLYQVGLLELPRRGRRGDR